jgi:invasion protein IalB
MPTLRAFCLAAVLSTLALSGAQGATVAPKPLGTFTDWDAFTFTEDGKQVCYMTSAAKKKDPATPERKNAFILVTHRPADKTFDVVSILAGTALKKDGAPKAVVDDRAFSMFADGDSAWAKDAQTDRAIVEALRKGSTLILKADLDKGRISDTYSLKGFSAAYDAIGKACDVKR